MRRHTTTLYKKHRGQIDKAKEMNEPHGEVMSKVKRQTASMFLKASAWAKDLFARDIIPSWIGRSLVCMWALSVRLEQ